jgi:hypothetical protein
LHVIYSLLTNDARAIGQVYLVEIDPDNVADAEVCEPLADQGTAPAYSRVRQCNAFDATPKGDFPVTCAGNPRKPRSKNPNNLPCVKLLSIKERI